MAQAQIPVDVAPLNNAEETAWFSTMALVMRGLPLVERTFRPYKLVYVEYLLLTELAATPRGRRMNELAGCVQASPSRLSHRIRKLIDLGYVEQQPDVADGRGAVAVITPHGRRVVDDVTPAHLRDLRQLIFNHLNADQVDSMADTMATIAARLKDSTDAASP